ncbi:MBL fold metallo-hydrolase [Konateibacter massiliensis]|uniref:MBL fold metallo-hydrolase n=1 Tax=Konateibacter massiliensis TaxID=2002841 RepID=UPI000C162429|nr:MBL fold metallo-hydrolase [Konateibacter massiliensis]
MEYYQSEKLSERLYRITEIGGVCCYLVVGDSRACLLDTGCGYGNLREYIETITDKPVFVLLTHGHHDHMGACALFDEVYINPADLPVFTSFGVMEKRLEEAKSFEVLSHFTEKDLVPTRTEKIKPVVDGDVFDLGGITIKMLLVKGHTPGILCPLLVEERTIIFGDACGVGVLLFDEFSSTVSEYRDSLLNLKKYEKDYDRIYRNHGTFSSPKELLDNVIECCDLILAGEDDHQPVSIHGFDLFAAKAVNEHGRIDGKQGNIMYSLEKAR